MSNSSILAGREGEEGGGGEGEGEIKEKKERDVKKGREM